jgi:hypothetical protein
VLAQLVVHLNQLIEILLHVAMVQVVVTPITIGMLHKHIAPLLLLVVLLILGILVEKLQGQHAAVMTVVNIRKLKHVHQAALPIPLMLSAAMQTQNVFILPHVMPLLLVMILAVCM